MTLIVKSDDLRRQNQRRILSALRGIGPLSRTALANVTGLSASTVTAITTELMEHGYLAEADVDAESRETGSGRRGRPQVALLLNPDAATIGALSVSLNRLSASLIDYSGRIVCEVAEKVNTQSLSPDMFAAILHRLLKQCQTKTGTKAGPLRQVMVSVQGVSDAGERRIQWSPITPYRNLELADELEALLNVPVSVANDANMIAAALKSLQPERYGESFAAILLSHGIGMGLFLNGALFTGVLSSAAEFGHMCHIPDGALCRCGRHGCIEAYAGDYGIWRMAHGGDPAKMPEVEIDLDTVVDLANRAEKGDKAAIEAYRVAGEAIGHGLRSLFALLDPLPVAFVGSGALAFEMMEPMIRKSLGIRGVGLSHEDVQFHCYENELELIETGTIMTALARLDSAVHLNREAREDALQPAQ